MPASNINHVTHSIAAEDEQLDLADLDAVAAAAAAG
jgi:hypothetical protein